MKRLKTAIKKKKKKNKDAVVFVKVTDQEKVHFVELADEWFDSNVSALVRYCIANVNFKKGKHYV